MTSKIELSRNQFRGICILIAVLGLALLLVLLKRPPPPPETPQPPKGDRLISGPLEKPVPKDLADSLTAQGYSVIMLPHADGIKIVNLNGGAIPPCKSPERETGVECGPNPKVDVRAVDQITILTVEGSPGCKWIYVGRDVRVHDSGSLNGLAPCEPSGSHSHSAP